MGKQREEFDDEVTAKLEEHNVDIILMVGYMRIVSDKFVRKWAGRVLNVHPSLLPAFAGGMDLDVHQAVLDAGVEDSGCTVHFVTEVVDGGPIAVQLSTPVFPGETAADLKRHVQALEGRALVRAVQMFAAGDLDKQRAKCVHQAAQATPTSTSADAPAAAQAVAAVTLSISPLDIGMDIGGSRSKIAVRVDSATIPKLVAHSSDTWRGSVLLRQYERIDELTAFCGTFNLPAGSKIRTAGGGGHKFNEHFKEVLGVALEPVPEIDALVAGLNTTLLQHESEVHYYSKAHKSFANAPEKLFPYLLLNLGSGVSFVIVSGKSDFKRVNGSHMGGATFHGLATLLTGTSDYSELMKTLGSGEQKESIAGTAADLTVADIYGEEDCVELGLPAGLLASSFGKVPQVTEASDTQGDPRRNFEKHELLEGLVIMMGLNLAQVACLEADSKCISTVVLAGGWLEGNEVLKEVRVAFPSSWCSGSDE
jgi:pantothenate kinase/formyltetrahydrofolate-dependent phosphoribosylglycinamide formyltransferase